MTETLTTRGPFNENPGLLVRWMLKSGEDGIRLYVPTGNTVAVLELADVHEAGDLYVALEAHMENIADGQERAGGVGPVEEARSMGEEERRAMTPNVPRTWTPDHREANMAAVQEQIDNPLFGGEDPGKSPVWALDREFLGAMADVVEAWVNQRTDTRIVQQHFQDKLRRDWPTLAAALDRLATLNA